jgi:hypothetical protein
MKEDYKTESILQSPWQKATVVKLLINSRLLWKSIYFRGQ